jgi:RNA polymerase primary sigma factor
LILINFPSMRNTKEELKTVDFSIEAGLSDAERKQVLALLSANHRPLLKRVFSDIERDKALNGKGKMYEGIIIATRMLIETHSRHNDAQADEVQGAKAILEDSLNRIPKRRGRPAKRTESAAESDDAVLPDEGIPDDQIEEEGEKSALDKYFKELKKHPVMSPAEEAEAARDIMKSEIKYWEALLSYPEVFETIVSVLARNLNELKINELPDEVYKLRKIAKTAKNGRPEKSDSGGWNELAGHLSDKLRECDKDRVVVADVNKAVHRHTGMYSDERNLEGGTIEITPAFIQYLQRVKAAYSAQQEAKNKFVSANLRLALSVARRYNRGRLPLADLIQEGNIGLTKAAERFDHRRGYRFSTYATWWIRHSITRAIADTGRIVRLPVHIIETYNRLSRAASLFTNINKREPTIEDLAGRTGIKAEKIRKIQSIGNGNTLSLDRSVNEEDSRPFGNFIESEGHDPFDDIVSDTRYHRVEEYMAALTPMEARILRWRFGLNDEDELTLKEIGDKYNLSRERIRQLQEQALEKIRRHFPSSDETEY